jgi:acyl-coenzyme A thioesterase PaaI-like protein
VTDPAEVGTASSGDSRPNIAAQFAEHLSGMAAAPVEDRVAAARRVGDAFRQAIDHLTATGAPAADLLQIEKLVSDIADRLREFGSSRHYEGTAEASGMGHDRAHFDWSPLLGMANPLAPPLQASVEDGIVVGRVRFGAAYEGPPGCVHGGYVAAAFDEVLGLAQSLSGQVGMTANLTVRYRRPTPLHTDLRFEGRLLSVNGRKVIASGVLLAGEEVTAEAEGLFITVTPERFAALSELRQRARDAE